jgi:hypothetical protein
MMLRIVAQHGLLTKSGIQECDESTTNISTTTKNSLTNAIVINHEIIGRLASCHLL